MGPEPAQDPPEEAGTTPGASQVEDHRREPLTRGRIAAAALSLVDQEGLDSLTMRRIAAELGFETMALYRHFPSKAALLDHLVEAILSEMELPPAGGDPWQTLESLARGLRRLAHTHPHAFPVVAARPVALRGAMEPVELTLRALGDAGCAEEDLAHAFRYLVSYVYGSVQRELVDRARATPFGPDHWYDLRRVPPDRFPSIAAASSRFAGYDFDASFDWGLRAALEGLRSQLPRRRRRQAR